VYSTLGIFHSTNDRQKGVIIACLIAALTWNKVALLGVKKTPKVTGKTHFLGFESVPHDLLLGMVFHKLIDALYL
jgi:hypothetical protein